MSQFERRRERRESNPTPWWLAFWLVVFATGFVMRVTADPTLGTGLIIVGVLGILGVAVKHGVWDFGPW